MKKRYIFSFLLFFLHLGNLFCQTKPTSKVLKQSAFSQTMPEFFTELFKKYQSVYLLKEHKHYQQIFTSNDISFQDSNTISTYLKLSLLHDLFTSKSATNGSKGSIISIPYFWHWTTPNQRLSIYSLKEKKLLSECKSPTNFSKYENFAMIDRTPDLFLKDLFSKSPNYYLSSCDTFATFGWCSEREMSFVFLLDMLGIKGKIYTSGNHCWTEVIVKMILNNKNTCYFRVEIDNTFDKIYWSKIDKKSIPAWEKNFGTSDLKDWYNKKAHNTSTIQYFKTYKIPPAASIRIHTALKKCFNEFK